VADMPAKEDEKLKRGRGGEGGMVFAYFANVAWLSLRAHPPASTTMLSVIGTFMRLRQR